jgi:hypothetical protein
VVCVLVRGDFVFETDCFVEHPVERSQSVVPTLEEADRDF